MSKTQIIMNCNNKCVQKAHKPQVNYCLIKTWKLFTEVGGVLKSFWKLEDKWFWCFLCKFNSKVLICVPSLNCSLSVRSHYFKIRCFNGIFKPDVEAICSSCHWRSCKCRWPQPCWVHMIDTTKVHTLVQIQAGWHCIIEQLSYTTLTNKFTLTCHRVLK